MYEGENSNAQRDGITPAQRNKFFQKILRVILPTPSMTAMKSKRLHYSIACAKKIEGELFEAANSETEYSVVIMAKLSDIDEASKRMQQKQADADDTWSGAVMVPSPSELFSGCFLDNSPPKNWQDLISLELRRNSIDKILQFIVLNSEQKCYKHLDGYANKVESIVFQMANSRAEYFDLLMEKLVQMVLELDEKQDHQPGNDVPLEEVNQQ